MASTASSHESPKLTLSVGGVDFVLIPAENSLGSVKFGKDQDELVLNLQNYSGALRVATASRAPTVASATETSPTRSSYQVTPRSSNLSAPLPRVEADSSAKRTHSNAEEDGSSPCQTKKTRPSSPFEDDGMIEEIVDEATIDPDATQPTLLGQLELSQTQSSSTEVAMANETPQVAAESNTKVSSKVQIILENTTLTQTGEKDEEENVLSPQDETTSADKVPSVRVSIGMSPTAPKGPAPPCPRWAHTFTDIGMNRFLVYGGQTFDAESGLPKTMSDLIVYDADNKSWFKPYNCDGMPRQWHTSTFLPERQLLISFGGEAANPKTGKVKTTDKLMVLDTEIMLWYPPSVSGDIPSGRSGHTATFLPKTNELVVLGGVKGSKWLNTVSVLDVVRWKWSSPKIQGASPKPRSYHSATTVNDRIVVFGGNDANHSYNTVHVLEKDQGEWKWTNPSVKGCPPSPRTGHSATLLRDGKTLCIYGGWDPNSDDDKAKNDSYMFCKDTFLLDTETWTWRKGPQPTIADLPWDAHGMDGGPMRVGHAAVTLDGEEILIFGGRVPGDRFAGDFQSLTVKDGWYK